MQILEDIFPAEVSFPDGTVLQRARVFVLDEGVVVYGEENHTPKVVYRGRHQQHPELPRMGTPRLHWRATIHSEDGVMRVNRMTGCGCGSSLVQVSLRQQLEAELR